jgi:raffinose/stachyose/melibiose transport system permease protein
VAVFTMIPIWNDLWFPLILASGERSKTVTLGAQIFMGQFVNDWNAVLASLSLAMVPIIVLYVIFSRQLIRGPGVRGGGAGEPLGVTAARGLARLCRDGGLP